MLLTTQNTEQNMGVKKPSMKDILDAKKRNERFRYLFKLPTEETLTVKFDASLSYKTVFVQGKIYLSPNYVCFHSLLPEDKGGLRQGGNGQITAGAGASGSSPNGGSSSSSMSNFPIGVKGLRDGGMLAESVLRGRRANHSFINTASQAPFLKLVVPFVEITQMGLEDDGPGAYLIALNTKRNQVLTFTLVLSGAESTVFASVRVLNHQHRRVYANPRAQE